MLRRSTDKCMISVSRVVRIMFGRFFVTTLLYAKIRKQFA